MVDCRNVVTYKDKIYKCGTKLPTAIVESVATNNIILCNGCFNEGSTNCVVQDNAHISIKELSAYLLREE